LNYENIPGAFLLIIDSALSGQAAVGGFAGATVAYAVRFGICSMTGLVIVLFCVPCGYRHRYQCGGTIEFSSDIGIALFPYPKIF